MTTVYCIPWVELKQDMEYILRTYLPRHVILYLSENGLSSFIQLFLFIRQPFSFVTSDVVEATCQCLLAQAEDAESHKLSQEDTEGMIIGEFGRCLKQVCLRKSNCLFFSITRHNSPIFNECKSQSA